MEKESNLKEKVMVQCNRNCEKCKQLNVKTDDKGYPFSYECMKYEDSVFLYEFGNTKEFKETCQDKT